MHILVVNDDGPPSSSSSPYVHSLIRGLQSAGHAVSVVLPHTQRSWIGKAHMIGQTVKPTYFRPGNLHKDDGTTHSRPLPAGSKDTEEWVLVDGTPASCVQIGLYHYFHDRGPVDLVVSGPNFGRNSTAVFSLSSGTLGGALEAAICRRRAIALSYAFFKKERPDLPDSANDPEIIAQATDLSVRLINHLYQNWGEDVNLYSINVPLVEEVGQRKIMWTHMLQNYWGNGSCFKEVEDDEGTADEEEQRIRQKEGGSGETPEEGITRHKHKHFKWAPQFVDVYKSVEEAGPGNDGWAVKEHYTSVTPLKSNFMHAAAQMDGELKLPPPSPTLDSLSLYKQSSQFFALIDYEDDYVQHLILSALNSQFPPGSYTLVSSIDELPSSLTPFLQISSYETLPFEHALSYPSTSLISAYAIRKALIRKHYLGNTAYNWTRKHPSSVLSTNVKVGCEFEVDYAEFLDEALVEAWELNESLQGNEEKQSQDRDWWILKPGMSDRGQGIRLFSTESELQSIFEEWDPESDDEDENEQGEAVEGQKLDEEEEASDGIVTSHLRHFITQPYIHPPLLTSSSPCKFHIRTYVLASGSLSIYVYKPMLALFSSSPYTPPWESPSDLLPHLTNTCLQSTQNPSSNYPPVKLFWSLDLEEQMKEDIWRQICEVTGEIFEAAARGMMVHFQTLPNAFEIFGLDFLCDADGVTWLLEVNAFPDFRQTGDQLKGLVGGLWDEVIGRVVGQFFGIKKEEQEAEQLVLVRKVALGRKA